MTVFQMTVLNMNLKHFFLVDDNVLSTLEVFTTVRYKNLHLHFQGWRPDKKELKYIKIIEIACMCWNVILKSNVI